MAARRSTTGATWALVWASTLVWSLTGCGGGGAQGASDGAVVSDGGVDGSASLDVDTAATGDVDAAGGDDAAASDGSPAFDDADGDDDADGADDDSEAGGDADDGDAAEIEDGDAIEVADDGGSSNPDADPDAAADATDDAGSGPDDVAPDGEDSDAGLPDVVEQDADATGAGDAVFTGDVEIGGDAAGVPDPATSTTASFPAGQWPGVASPTAIASLPAAPLAAKTAIAGVGGYSGFLRCAASGLIDADGRLDAVVIGEVPASAKLEIVSLLAQPGAPKVVTTPLAVAMQVPDGGCALVDVSGDGLDDLILGGSGGLLLYRSKGDGTFLPVPAAFPAWTGTTGWTMAPIDIDGDGDLDLFVGSGQSALPCGTATCSVQGADLQCSAPASAFTGAPLQDRLLLQVAPGLFADATALFAVAPAKFLSTAIATDLDGQAGAEVLVGGDFGPSRLWTNGPGGLVDATPASLPKVMHSGGWGVGDLDGDGDFDLVGADAGPMVVLGHDGGPLATAYAAMPAGHPVVGLSWSSRTWNPQLIDLDQDGNLDIYAGVGLDWANAGLAALQTCPLAATKVAGVDLLLRGGGQGMSFVASRGAGIGCGGVGALAQSPLDLDLDGDLDLLQVRPGCKGEGALVAVQNDHKGTAGLWIRLQGPPGNRDAIGARVVASIGGKVRVRRIEGVVGPGSSALRLVHFGLGTSGGASGLSVHWPDGSVTHVGEVVAAAATSAAPLQVSWSPPALAAPVEVTKLPAAAFVDVTASLALPNGHIWAPCVGVGNVDGDNVPDIVVVSLKNFESDPQISVVTHGFIGGKSVKTQTFPQGVAFPEGGCVLFDADADGDDDLVVGSNSGMSLLRNKGGTFVYDDAAFPDLPSTAVSSVTVADFDRDGDVDVYVGAKMGAVPCGQFDCSYSGAEFSCLIQPNWSPPGVPVDRLLVQDKPGHFVDASTTWGVPAAEVVAHATAHDIDDDGWVDVLIGNDFGHQYVLHNNGGKSFTSQSIAGLGKYGHSMGWGVGDLDGDGDLDLVHADAGPSSSYLRIGTGAKPLSGPPAFAANDASAAIVPNSWYLSVWAPMLEDFDQDGRVDILLGAAMSWHDMPLAEIGKCTFDVAKVGSPDLLLTQTAAGSWTATRTPPRTCGMWGLFAQSLVDIDLDGDLDVVQVSPGCSFGGELRVLRNDLSKGGGVVQIRLVGPKGNPSAFGARVSAKIGAAVRVHAPGLNVGPGSISARDVHFGLGAAASAEDVQVRWPDGSVTKHGTLQPGQIHVLTAGGSN